MKLKTIPVFLAFLCMGFGDAIGPFVGLAKDTFQLNNFMSGFIAFAGFSMFGLLSVPFGIIQDKAGKKFVLSLGLFVALAGMLIPVVFKLQSFEVFVLTVFLLGAGAAILQVAGNPIMRDVSAEGKYASNLSMAQFIKSIGSLSGPLLPVAAALWFNKDWKIIFPVYLGSLILTLVLILLTKTSEKKKESTTPATFASCFALLANPFVLLMVLGIFFYVGAEVSMSAFLPEFLKQHYGINMDVMISSLGFNTEALISAGINTQTFGVLGTGFFFVGLMIGRFLGSIILNWLSPKRFLMWTGLLAVFAILLLFLASTQTQVFIIMALIGIGFANIFPLIFSITVESMPERTNELSGLMITAILGGAVVPLLTGALTDAVSIFAGFMVPAVCMVFIITLSFNTRKQ
jgi:fucose permease